jgi:hypothetical protein
MKPLLNSPLISAASRLADSRCGNQRYEVSEDQRLGQAEAHGVIRAELVFLLSPRLIDSLYHRKESQ